MILESEMGGAKNHPGIGSKQFDRQLSNQVVIIIVCFGIFFSISKQESLFYEIADRLFITVIIVIITVFMSLFDKDKW